MSRPSTETYPPHFHNYVSQVVEDDLFQAFKNQQPVIENFFPSIPEEKTNAGYAPGKWTLKELLQHIIDAERVFAYRALCFARKETISLPAFDENTYADNSHANKRAWKSLCEELKVVRQTTEMLFNSFPAEVLDYTGIANNKTASVLAMGFISIGHLAHHKRIIEERYLVPDN